MITAVDVGATKTLVAQFSEAMELINEVRFPTPEDPAVFLTELKLHISKLPTPPTSLSVGIPGVVIEGVVRNCANLPLWKNIPLTKTLHTAYKCPVFIENDANLAGLAEINSITPLPRVGIYLTVSTGIGCGLVLDGHLSPHFKQAEMGHIILRDEGRWDHWEHFASGKAIVKHFDKLAHDLHTPQEWQWVAEKVAMGLYALIPVLHPEVIVFGGGVGSYLEQYKKPLVNLLEQQLPQNVPRPKLLLAQHPNEAVLYGCYYLATHSLA